MSKDYKRDYRRNYDNDEYNGRDDRNDRRNNNGKPKFSFLGLLIAILFAGSAFYLFTIVMPKIGGQEFDIEKTTSIVNLAKGEKIDFEEKENEETVSEESSVSKNDDTKFGSTEKLIESSSKTATGFFDFLKNKFFNNDKDVKKEESKPKQVIEQKEKDVVKTKATLPKQTIEQKEKDTRVILSKELAEKNKKNDRGEIVNDLSYYE